MTRPNVLARHGVLILLVAASFFPVYYLLVNSLKNPAQFAADQWLPASGLHPGNYSRAWDVIARPLLNSVVVTGVSVVLIVAVAALAAYSFSIIRFPGHRVVFWLVFALLMIPSFLLLLPLYLQISNLPFRGGYPSIILPSVAAGLPFTIVVIKAFFDEIPGDLIDAARVDGASELVILRRIVAPLSWPAFASAAIIQAVALWNDYLLPSLVLDRAHRTVSVGLVAFTGNPGQNSTPDYGPLMAGYVLSAIPLVIMFVFLMRAYIDGLTQGATKL